MWQEENPRYDHKQYIQGCPGGIEENTKSCISNIHYSSEYILEVIERFEKDKKHLVSNKFEIIERMCIKINFNMLSEARIGGHGPNKH